MEGHTSQFGPHQEIKKLEGQRKPSPIFREQSREHILILLALLFFSVNIALAFTHSVGVALIVDDIPQSDQSASISHFFKF